MTTRDTRNAPSPSLPQHQISQQRQKRQTPFDQTGVHYNSLGCTCVCENECTCLSAPGFILRFHCALYTHQDQSSTPEGHQSPPAFPLVVSRKLSSVDATVHAHIHPAFLPCTVRKEMLKYWRSSTLWACQFINVSIYLSLSADTRAAFRTETESFWDSSGLSLGSCNGSSQLICSYCMSHQQYMNKRTHTRTHTEIKRLSYNNLTLDKRPNFMFGINYLSFPPILTPLNPQTK